jgi:release factor glutamine methyltransferase
MSETWTARSLLAWMAKDFQTLGIASARLDAELLIAYVLQLDRVALYMDLDRPLTAAELSTLRALVVRRRQREPIAYLIGRREFYRRSFEVDPAVLIPRPDTETLIERALELLPLTAAGALLDLCTGSGAIAITLAAERPLAHVTATDLSRQALAVAGRNATKLGVAERVSLLHGDLFEALPPEARFDVVLANPPYVSITALAELSPELKYEPELALFAGAAGLDVLTRLCAGVAHWLAPQGTLLFEVGAGQAQAVLRMLVEQPLLTNLRVHRDLGDIERVVEAQRGTTET